MKGASWRWAFSVGCLLAFSLACRADTYVLVAADSQLRVLVDRAGPLGGMGHRHVISAGALSGEIQFRADAPQAARFRLQVPVAELVVDDPRQRRAAGPEFSAVPDDEAIRATRANMLGAKVLDAARYPMVTVRSVAVSGTLPELKVRMVMDLHGVEREMTVPVRVRPQGSRLQASGTLRFRQRSFGIEPLKILLGAIAVQDEVTVQYQLVAARQVQ